MIYNGNGFNISNCGDEYKISWMKWYGGYDKEVSYTISEENAHKAMKSDKDAQEVMIFAETGHWPVTKAEKFKQFFESKGVDLEDFAFGEVVYRPGIHGLTSIDGKWYIYNVDDHCEFVFTGPFEGPAIIKACSVLLCDDDIIDYEFTDEELETFIHRHYYSMNEVQLVNKALDIIHSENLTGYNLFDDGPDAEYEVAIQRVVGGKYEVYATDERANVPEGSRAGFENEEDAINDFLKRLRAAQCVKH